jgi:hypothetical protein
MAFPLALLLPALLPPVADGLRGLFTRLTGGAGVKPSNITEAIAFMEAEAKMAQAMAALDQPAANISRWVADLRASFRYIAAGVLILAPYGLLAFEGIFRIPVGTDLLLQSHELSGQAFSFVFGDRMYRWIKR